VAPVRGRARERGNSAAFFKKFVNETFVKLQKD